MKDDVHRLELVPLADDAWRLCDRAVATCDADSLIAYVELRRDGRYEVTWVAHGFGVDTYAALGDLLRNATRMLAASAARRDKPVPIPHRPPLAV